MNINIEEPSQLRIYRMNDWLKKQENRLELVYDYLGELGICPQDLYDYKLEERFVRSLFEDIYSCNERLLWDFLNYDYDYYLEDK